ncbi:MAG: dephospho-CoA kinase [Bacteroidota bacterium]|nr:dephospho-CoA kinase [Bacteroidota bacterium]
MQTPLRIGLTGGIGSGKSTVAKVFEVLGVPVFYADIVTKEMMNSNVHLRDQLMLAFGEETYANNKLNRAYLSSIVFNDATQLQRLNSIVHPVAIAEAQRWFSQQTAPYVIKEAALLFEAGTAKELDYIIGVSAPQYLRIQRVMKRDGITEEGVLQRMSKQMDEAEKMKQCNFILINDEEQMLLPHVIALHEQLLKL